MKYLINWVDQGRNSEKMIKQFNHPILAHCIYPIVVFMNSLTLTRFAINKSWQLLTLSLLCIQSFTFGCSCRQLDVKGIEHKTTKNNYSAVWAFSAKVENQNLIDFPSAESQRDSTIKRSPYVDYLARSDRFTNSRENSIKPNANGIGMKNTAIDSGRS